VLTSLQNPLVKQLRKLQQTKERHRQGQALLEGTHLMEEACHLTLPLEIVCCTERWQERYPLLWHQLSSLAERVEVVSEPILEAIATTVHPDGVVATIQRDRLFRPLQATTFTMGVALESIQDPGNLGTMIRTAAAVGVDALWLSQDCVDPDHPKVLRASAGQWFRLPMTIQADLPAHLTTLKQQGMQIVATLPEASQSYWEVDFTQPTVIVVGNEGAGLSPTLEAIASMQVHIPQESGVESLNVAIATALILYETRRQRTMLNRSSL
jgi:TrmH family RNA methyltransferase